MQSFLSFATRYRFLLLISAATVSVVAVAVFAIENENTIHVFPTHVQNEGWMKEELALEQNLGGQAMFDDFNRSNASFVIFTLSEDVEAPGSADTDTSNEEVPQESNSQSDETQPETNTEEQSAENTMEVNENVEGTQEEVTPEPLPDVSMLEYLRGTARGVFAYQARAQEETQTSEEDSTAQDTPDENVASNEGDAPVENSISDDVISETTEDALPGEDVQTEDAGTEGLGEEQSDAYGYSGQVSEDVRVCHVLDTDCHTIEFSGFDIGSVLSEETVTGYTLKASLAARTIGERFTDDKILVRYFYRGKWHLAGEIAIDESISNFENGGYYTFALPNLRGWDALYDFKVEFELVRQNDVRTEVFLDSVWVETTYRSDSEKKPNFPPNVIDELAELEQSKRGDLLRAGDKVVEMPFVSTGSSDLVMRTSETQLESPGTGELFISVTNIGSEKKDFNLSFYMPDEESEPQVLRQWMYNIPKESEVVEYGSLAQYCEKGWVAAGDEDPSKYICTETGEDLSCGALNEDATNCIQDSVEVGRHVEVAYEEGWHETKLLEAEQEEQEEGFLNRVRRWFSFTKQPKHEDAISYTSENTYSVAPDQTLYFSVRVRYPQISEGGFAVEAENSDGVSSMDIAWKSDWRYRLPVAIDKTVTGNTVTLTLDANDNPHLFSHVKDFSNIFIREIGSDDTTWLPYTYTVLAEDQVELVLDLSTFSANASGVYLYYSDESVSTAEKKERGKKVFLNPEALSLHESNTQPSSDIEVLGYAVAAPEEVVLENEKSNRVIAGDRGDGSLPEDGKLVFAYRTNKTELREGDFAKVVGSDTFTVRNVKLTYEDGQEVPNTRTAQTVGNEWVLDVGMNERALRPGKYTLEVEVIEGERAYIETQVFYWGVLTWNTTKSVYAQGETALMHMAALSNSGNTICDANLSLTVRNPSGQETVVPVQQSGSCDGNNVTDVPDYLAEYVLPETGTYNVLLRHMDTEGTVLHEIEDTIVVEQATPYIVERSGPTRIYPVADYTMTLHVSAQAGYVGTVREVVPEFFSVYDYGSAMETVEGSLRYLEWDVSVAPGETIELSYTFDAPDISPYVYRIGPASLGAEFTEMREWQIASDATGNMLLFWDDGASIPSGWTCVSCAPGDPFYQRFVIGSSTYNNTGGATTHTHTAVGTVYAIGSGATENFGSGAISIAGHTHTYTPTISSPSNLPLYRQLRVIQYNSVGEPPSIPTGAIAIFDATVPTGWTRYSAQDGYFIYGENTPSTIGGTSTHNHAITGSTGAAAGSDVGARGGAPAATGAATAHTHTVSSATGYKSNEPPYIEVILGKLDATTTPLNSMITMWSGDVPSGWITVSSSSEAFENKFIKPSASYGTTGGTTSHTHANKTGITTSSFGATTARGGTTGAGIHSHTADVTDFATSTHLPPYVSVVFGKRFSNTPVYTQNYYRFYANALTEPPTDPWPAGASDLAENARINTTEYTSKGDVVRIRMSVQISNATSTAYTDAFKLQYAAGSTCSDGGLVWYDVAPISSTTAPWRGYNNSGLSDGATTSSTTLSVSDVFETYEEENNSASTTNDIVPGQDGEWDWVVQHNEASAGTDYCFRMVKSNGTVFSGYNNYPQLITDEAPVAPTLITPFNNKKATSTGPTFTFYSTDPEGDSIQYQIQIDSDYAFSAPVIDADSISSPSSFDNVDTPADKPPFNSGDTIRYTPGTTLTNNTTYWWRVRGRDSAGSDQWGAWSQKQSFTVDTSVTISTWFQTTDEQFDTDTLVGAQTSGGSDQVALIVGSSTGSITSTTIDFDWGTYSGANAWGYLYFTDTETSSDLKYQIEFYDTSDEQWKLIPDSDLSGNSTGFDTTGVSLLALDTTTYNQIRIKGNLTNAGASPILQDWAIAWGTRVQQPTLSKLFDNEKTSTTTPAFEFTTTDPQGDDLVYQISWSTDYTFTSGTTTRTSDSASGFQNLASSTDTSPFISGNAIRFTVQGADALTNNTTYWWRVRAKDPSGGDTWSDWSERWSFTVDTTVTASTWFQTTNEQFDKGGLYGITTMGNNAEVATSVKEVLIAYGEGTSETPKYRFWDGSAWGSERSALNVGAPQYWVVTRAHPSAEIYALATIGSDADVNIQIYQDGVWGSLQELTTTISNTNARGVDMAFETTSGNLMVAYCDGDADPSYRVYSEATGWGSPGVINLASTNNCEWIRLASDPTSNEIVVVSLDSAGSQYEAQVWNGSTWGNSTTLGSMVTSGYEGMAVMYEESGGQAMVAVSDGNGNRFRYTSWNGTTWAAATTEALGDNFQWGNLIRDNGTDAMALCYIDYDIDIGVVQWTGSAWTAFSEIETVGNADTDRPVDCRYETKGLRDGYLMANYSDDTNGRYQYWNGASWSAEASVSTITDSATVQSARSDDGLILSVYFDDVNGQYDFSYWDGSSWSAAQTLEDNPSVTGSPFKEPFMMAPRNSAVAGTLYSPTIDYDSGTGPQWNEVTWSDSEPGGSTLTYQVQYYDTASSTWKLVPDAAIPGNSTGTSTSPINISGLNTTTYNQLRIKANFTCNAGSCPTLNDWTVTWSEGFTVSGIAKQFDQATNVTSGSVAIAVNGSLQIGKTGTISGGTWTINNITAFANDVITVWVDGANEANEAVAVTQYDGVGPVTGMTLYERHLGVGSDDNPTISNTNLAQFDNSVSGDEDIFYDIDASNNLYVCESGQATCGAEQLWVRASSTFQPSTSTAKTIRTHDIDIEGTIVASGNTFEVSGSWTNVGTFTANTSSVVFNATSTSEIINSTGATTASFNAVTFGQGVSTASWALSSPFDVNGNLTLSSGTLAPGAGYAITVAGNLSVGASGIFTKNTGTTTFDGTGTSYWSDASSPKQDMGTVVVDGTSKTIAQSSGVLATTVTIGADDILAQGGFTLELKGSFNNTGSLVPQSGEVLLTSTGVGNTINGGASSFYNLTFNGVGGNWSFPSGSVSISNDVTITNGIVTMPTGTTTVGGSLAVTGGQFVHNNGLWYFTSNLAKTIAASTSPFFDLKFNGNGSWVINGTNATSSNDVTIQSGTVTLPSGTFSVGGSFLTTAGSFNHASGTVRLYSSSADSISANTSRFYNVLIDGSGPYTITSTNLSILGNLTIATGSLTFPTGTLTLGGSLTNSGGSFSHNTGTVLFAASSTGHSILTNGSAFYNAIFNSASGGWTFTGNASTTNNLSLTAANSFTAPNGGTLEVRGVFTNSVGVSATTWTNSTLYLNSASTSTINTKTSGADAYGTLQVGANTDVKMWNSSSSVYTVDSTGSLYSQDHSGTDGSLYVWGSYERTSGIEHWSWATDFDGTSLSGGSERLVQVRFASGAHATVTNATLSIQGSATASTTVTTQGAGTFGVEVTNGAVDAKHYSFSELDANGFMIMGSSTVTDLSYGDYLLTVDTGTLLQISSTTLDGNPAKQFLGLYFATSTSISGYNVGVIGIPTSYWTFKNHRGGLSGEAYDNDPGGDPGNLRWDDSGFVITVQGTVYQNEVSGVPTFCDDATPVVYLKVNGLGSYSASCNSGTGVYSIPNVTFSGDAVLTAYIKSVGTVGAAITKTPNTDINNFDLYEHRVIVRHEDTAPLTITDLAYFDDGDDSDIPFAVSLGAPNVVTFEPDTALFIWTGKTFAPGGNVVLQSGGSGASYDGSIRFASSSTLTASGTESYSIGGSWVADTSSTFTRASSTVTFTATTTGKTIAPSAHFNTVVFNGSGGGWTIASSTTVRGSVTLTSGTVSGTGDLTVYAGPITGDGVFNMTSGTVTVLSGGNFGGASDWTFNNLIFSTTTATTTAKVGGGDVTIKGMLTLGVNNTLNAGSAEWFFSGSGTVFTHNGTFNPQTSTTTYNGTSTLTIAGVSYYNLNAAPTAGNPTYTIESGNFGVGNDMYIGGGTTVTVNANTNDPLITVSGDVIINTNATYQSASANDLVIGGSYDNNGTFTSNAGGVVFNSTDTGETVAPGNSSFHHVTFNSATGGWTITENATSTGNTVLTAASLWTLSSGRSLAVQGMFNNYVGGASTTWTDSTLSLNSGSSYSVNTRTDNGDVYGTLLVGTNTDVRVWYSSSTSYTVDSTGSLYSQDHNSVNGALYIYGDYIRSSGSDYWSRAKDFDGTDLTGSERTVNVYIQNGGNVTLSGGTLEILGTSTATTTIANQGTGTYGIDITGGTLNAQYYAFRNLDASGVNISGSPTITSMSNGDFELAVNGGSLVTVAASAITANPLKIMYTNRFATTTGATTGNNVTVTGTTGSSWRFTGHYGGFDGEGYDSDPTGDPGYVIWDNSAAQITLSGNVYGTNESSISSVCDGSTPVVRFLINGASPRTTSCNAATGYYEFTSIVYNVGDVFTVYLDTGGGAKAANVTVDPITNINDMHLYENRLVVRHESADPVTIGDLSAYDSDQDPDILFDADTGSPSTLTLNQGSKLIVWTGKSFAPGGNVTISSLGTGTEYDGTLELKNNASFVAAGTQSHIVGGSFVSGTGASLTPVSSMFTFTATTTGKTIDTNTSSFANLVFNGSGGEWTFLEGNATTTGDVTITNGTVTLATSTFAVGGSFVNNSVFVGTTTAFRFTASGAESVTFGGYDAGSIIFSGTGPWTMTDTNATSTGSFRITSGTVTLPSGNLSVRTSFDNSGGLFTHGNGTLLLYGSDAAQSLTFGSSSLANLTITGSGSWIFGNTNATTTGSITIASGGLTAPSGSLAIGASLVSSSTFNANAGTLRFFATSTGKTVNANGAILGSVIFQGTGGGWTVATSATSTSDWRLKTGASFTMATGTVLEVGGSFENTIGGSATNWTNSTLYLNASGTTYAINGKTSTGDTYAFLTVGTNTRVSMWNSSAATTTVSSTGYLYSQDHASFDGNLYIYGTYERTSGSEYWSYATDFDGTALGGSSRAVDVRIASSSAITLSGGTLNIVGASGFTSTVDVITSGAYALSVTGGTVNAQYYSIKGTDTNGLRFTGSPSITTLNNGTFELSTQGGSMITVSSSTINNNPSRTFSNISFSTSTGISSGYNVSLDGSTSNIWQFTSHSGNYDGEDYDNDGADACGQIRWSDSACLEVSQTHYRFRNDDGGEAAPDSEWYDVSWSKRRPIKINNNGGSAITNYAIKVEIPYDSDMQADFDDLRFTDDSGTTSLSYWFENVTLSATATAWIKVPTVAADSITRIYYYYGNALAASSEDGPSVFAFFDDFEDNNITEYSGNTSMFATNASFNYEGSYGLAAAGGYETGKTTGGIYRTGTTFGQGSTIRFFQKLAAGTDDEPCTLFAVQGSGQNYAVCLDQYPTDKVIISKNVTSNSNDSGGTELASSSVTWTAGWYEVVINWLTNNSINVTVYNSSGSTVATTSVTDSTYSSGGMGFSFWYQDEGWDFYSVRPYVASEPSYNIGVEQGSDGASWKLPQDTELTGQTPNENFRLRLTVENTGTQITGQSWRLQYAPKSTYGACEGVPSVNYNDVPNQASCGVSPICMTASTNITDQESTTEHLNTNLAGTFVNGHVVESPSNQTTAMTLEQDEYTEVEYSLEFTDFATESNYCLRTTNGGAEVDTYLRVAEASVRFSPVITNWKLNNDQIISLIEGQTKTIFATGTVSDLNGFEDILYATTTIYRSGVTESCTADLNNCYRLSSLECPLTNCSGNSCDVECSADIEYFAEPTDSGSDHQDEHWEAYLYVIDTTENVSTSTTDAVEMRTLWALSVTSGGIQYGTLDVGNDTGGTNATTTLQNTGNDNVDVELSGTDMTASGSSIPVANQLYATSSFTYSGCVICSALSGSASPYEIDLPKPTSTSTPITDTLYWGVYVPTGTGGLPHYGQNTFYATGD